MIDTIFTYKFLKNKTIISKGNNEISIPNQIFKAKSKELYFILKNDLDSSFSIPNLNKTNITFKITDSYNNPISINHLNEVNSIKAEHKYIKRMAKLHELGYKVVFDSYDDNTFKLNLQVIDCAMPEIIAHVVKDKYVSKVTKITEVIDKLKIDNPMNYDLSQGHKFYEYRLVNFLAEAALGMTSKSAWSGKYNVVDGIIIAKPNTEILCYPLIDFNKFKKYLKNSSRLDISPGSKIGYGNVYNQNDKSYIKLNFQIKV